MATTAAPDIPVHAAKRIASRMVANRSPPPQWTHYNEEGAIKPFSNTRLFQNYTHENEKSNGFHGKTSTCRKNPVRKHGDDSRAPTKIAKYHG
jgi:hypothetical protein